MGVRTTPGAPHWAQAHKTGTARRTTATQEAIRVVLRHPAYKLDDDDDVVIGGTFDANLDAQWYRDQCSLGARYGVDPYLFIAFSIVEYGGYRVGEDHNVNHPDRGLPDIPTGRAFAQRFGAAGVVTGDAWNSGVMCDAAVQAQLRAIMESRGQTPPDSCFSFSAESGKWLDDQSFILLSRLQSTALEAQHREYYWEGSRLRYRRSDDPSIAVGLQSLHGYGVLPYLYRAGQFGEGKLMAYRDGELVPGGATRSGVRGADHPIYGFTMCHFIRELQRNAQVHTLVKAGAPTPVAYAVTRDFGKPTRGLPEIGA